MDVGGRLLDVHGGDARPGPGPGRAEIDRIVEAVVDILAAEPLFAEPVSLNMLARMTGEQLGFPLQVPSVSFRRQWLLAFVAECGANDGGLEVLAAVVGRMDGRGRVYRAVDLLVRGTGGRSAATDGRSAATDGRSMAAEGRRPKPPFPGPASTSLTVGEVTALADGYSEPAAARRVLERAGLPHRHQPRHDRSGEAFWSEVNRLVIDGAFPDGRVRILRAAAADYPANPWFSTG
ncbi:effector-associated domain EAD1-containing protein [Frankia sp. AiPs1]|uniref:effector-associated domain 2-containing protein n=1 Tax=Frankia sp. AiPs1 TaxID=573493 RepID=UPI0020440B5C|nr:effector-associated domain EAD1-containing protein [Frankia sp. AiPs1]MCM3921079.1 effector-associated domain EAD1-containing protein [Frankia sp. AiPs1]